MAGSSFVTMRHSRSDAAGSVVVRRHPDRTPDKRRWAWTAAQPDALIFRQKRLRSAGRYLQLAVEPGHVEGPEGHRGRRPDRRLQILGMSDAARFERQPAASGSADRVTSADGRAHSAPGWS